MPDGSASTSQPEYLCPVDVPLRHLGGRWNLMLCFYLLQRPLRNGQLRRLVPQITQKMLTQQLRELEASGLVHREVYDELPPKVVYSIVESERAGLESVVDPLCRWGNDWARRHGGQIRTTSLPSELAE